MRILDGTRRSNDPIKRGTKTIQTNFPSFSEPEPVCGEHLLSLKKPNKLIGLKKAWK